ncbi:MAG: hypothetical protein M0002_04125 [Rhodospirillales bacterium]|nr:hypothetical protein [Rhodospirillales bacterium]
MAAVVGIVPGHWLFRASFTVMAMIGAAAIITDPVIPGPAISVLFGLLSSTLQTMLVIPVLYLMFRENVMPAAG